MPCNSKTQRCVLNSASRRKRFPFQKHKSLVSKQKAFVLMSNDTIIVSLLTIFIVKNSHYIARLSGKLSGMDDNSLNTLFP